MRFFNELYPDVAQKESLAIEIKDGELPDGEYAFLEYFCDNLACRCTTVLLLVLSLDEKDPKNNKVIAELDYAWEKPLSRNNPSLHKEGKQSDLAKDALHVFRRVVKDNAFIPERMNSHFEMIRKYVRDEKDLPNLKKNSAEIKTKRNDPCSCGSNKKYKKCCLNA